MLWIGCLTIVKSYIDIRLVLVEIWRGSQINPPEKTTFKKPTSLRIKPESLVITQEQTHRFQLVHSERSPTSEIHSSLFKMLQKGFWRQWTKENFGFLVVHQNLQTERHNIETNFLDTKIKYMDIDDLSKWLKSFQGQMVWLGRFYCGINILNQMKHQENMVEKVITWWNNQFSTWWWQKLLMKR